MVFSLFITFLIVQRLFELLIAARNERWLLTHGAVEFGKEHYPFMVTLHTLFIISLLVEYVYRSPVAVNYYGIAFFLILIFLKVYVISTLGKYWNTKIYRIPASKPVSSGIYKYIKHPNYVIVIFEIAVIPLSFHLFFTAVCFTILNAMMLYVRIKKENEALAL
ncbi:isoprenylcysteine carboxylmethyltransferase family protein [Mucilaginibacter sp. FT3.2]|uniref:isoprenylcysteine carboxyl methyltransferase family protein n=1 Tax=Mucilaginibacter sp. FT3.2 TaxID=2723090 RepID=UPI00161BD411|nr:methyltransferase [Mucilaginibacter sp. FT3.2]